MRKAHDTWLDRGMRREATRFREYPSSPCNNAGVFKGRRFFCGAFNPLDGYIEELHTWEEAKEWNFHHSLYFTPDVAEGINHEELVFFWVDRETGELGLWWRTDGTQYEPAIMEQIDIDPVPPDVCREESD